MEDIENIRMLRILRHLEKHPEIDLIHAIERKEIDTNTRAEICAVCGEEFIRSKRKIIGLQELNDILEKYNINNVAIIEYMIEELKISDINIQFVEKL